MQIGEGGLLPIEALGAEGRFLKFQPELFDADDPDAAWSDLPVYQDKYNDFLIAWILLDDELGKRRMSQKYDVYCSVDVAVLSCR